MNTFKPGDKVRVRIPQEDGHVEAVGEVEWAYPEEGTMEVYFADDLSMTMPIALGSLVEPPKPPRMEQPTDFGAMVIAHTGGDPRRKKFIQTFDFWAKEGIDWCYSWDELLDPEPVPDPNAEKVQQLLEWLSLQSIFAGARYDEVVLGAYTSTARRVRELFGVPADPGTED